MIPQMWLNDAASYIGDMIVIASGCVQCLSCCHEWQWCPRLLNLRSDQTVNLGSCTFVSRGLTMRSLAMACECPPVWPCHTGPSEKAFAVW